MLGFSHVWEKQNTFSIWRPKKATPDKLRDIYNSGMKTIPNIPQKVCMIWMHCNIYICFLQWKLTKKQISEKLKNIHRGSHFYIAELVLKFQFF